MASRATYRVRAGHEVTIDEHGCLHRECSCAECKDAFTSLRGLLSSGMDIRARYKRLPASWRKACDAAQSKRRKRAAANAPATRVAPTQLLAQRAITSLGQAMPLLDYREGSSPHAVNATNRSSAMIYTAIPHVRGLPEMVSRVGGYRSQGQKNVVRLELYVEANPIGWVRLTRCIADGIVLEKGLRRLAVQILDQQPDMQGAMPGDMIVAAGKQARGLEVVTRPALVRKSADNTWVVVRWLTWQALSAESVAVYGRALVRLKHVRALGDSGQVTAMNATADKPEWASARSPFSARYHEEYSFVLDEIESTNAVLDLFEVSLDDLRARRQEADEAILAYARTDMGRLAGCSARCGHCIESEQCPARLARLIAHDAVVLYETAGKKLCALEARQRSMQSAFAKYGLLPHEYDRRESNV